MVQDYKPSDRSRAPIDHTRCKAEVHYYIGNWPHYKQCNNKPKDDGYCGTHNPEKVAARRKASDDRGTAKFKAEVFARRFGYNGKALAEALVKIRDGDNDPRATAAAVLELVKWGE